MSRTVPSSRLAQGYSRSRRDGYAVFPALLGREELAEMGGVLESLAGRGLVAGAMITCDLDRDEGLNRAAHHPVLVEVAAALLAGDVVPFGCTFVVKKARTGLPALWHQDGHPWRQTLGITEAVTLWVALDRSDTDSGGLCVIPGSHHLEAQPLVPRPDVESVFGAGMDERLVEESLAVPLVLDAGDVSAHHPDLVHGSPANRSERDRRAMVVRYRPAV